jgi:hypothetical protein
MAGLLRPEAVENLNQLLNRNYQRAEIRNVDSDNGMASLLVHGPRGHQSEITLSADQLEKVMVD